ncbi:hypothetical protein GCM10023172_04930 [Hymenobacter ginsengisoli]|uniref:Uncharacterized protein n=1 Tax=Hymenobacter ginsengisoli TaxID=1051626 RepID=A0ABP8Q0V6_9BACT|nr:MULTISPECIES: hypothetical protein [unclassified Hymenobacter]MBO2030595.1 hypothetical protein [Hymenobacter sp. BT559]
MKALILLLLLLLGIASLPKLPTVRVVFSPLTRAAYMAASKHIIDIKPSVTFPLKKQHGRIIIPTAKGQRVFRDGWIEKERDEDARYTYRGYWPSLHWHLVEGYNYGEVYYQNVVTQGGQWIQLNDEHSLSPDTSQFVVTSGALDGLGAPLIQLYQLKNGAWRENWKIEPNTWQVEQLEWLTANTLLVKEKHWDKNFSKSWFTYARLIIQ